MKVNLKEKMLKTQGVYLITNLVNNKKYVGISNDIRQRWNAHKQAALNETYTEHNTPLHRAIRKYGIDNFSLEILEEVKDSSQLNDREIYWIQYYNSYNEGYNLTVGGKHVSGENHHHAAFTNKEVEEIRIRWAACKETVKEISKDYPQVNERSIYHITNWERYQDILPELNTPERRKWHQEQGLKSMIQNRKSHRNGCNKLSSQDVLEIRILHRLGWMPLKIQQEKYPFMAPGTIRGITAYQSWKEISYDIVTEEMKKRGLINEN